ncbi:low-density lipoprotein receptor-related protein 8-like [Ruditapes philippinarum]|uniref:low-density lipoprotein receptor-related protein 8-like n=1 Tax=Ruditapes philippinarum TaxID=129788 RepID=UPI00295BE7B7|nr:low-density lipoprotein receptor-related protein 8-like [Ruditapes philippinarum]
MAEERGIVMSVYAYPDDQKLKHLEKFPGYENVSSVLADGISFDDSSLRFDSIDIDFAAKTGYAYEENYRAILFLSGYGKALDVDNMVFDAVHYGVSLDSIQLAVDWLSKTVYWCDATYRWIVAASVHKDKVSKDYFKVIINDHLEKPAGIVVDPLEGYLFWSDSGKEAKIERSDLTGRNRKTIVSKGVTSPGQMTVDIADKRIYWIHVEAIHSANYDGTGPRHITRYGVSTLHDLAIFREVIYISDTNSDELLSVNKTDGLDVADPLLLDSYTIYGLAVYSAETQPTKDKGKVSMLDAIFCNCNHIGHTVNVHVTRI